MYCCKCCVITYFGAGTRQIRRQIAHPPPRLPHPELDGCVLKRGGCKVPAVAEHVVVGVQVCDAKDFPLLLR